MKLSVYRGSGVDADESRDRTCAELQAKWIVHLCCLGDETIRPGLARKPFNTRSLWVLGPGRMRHRPGASCCVLKVIVSLTEGRQ
ncbi:hypothetical protein RRG08_031095 [Elysia crispata]|uniref:Uncharacterized protein n=1 Tax=Elysia crispata TaxID=231223 RepID=A0AAE0ZFD4_9GAST|nr:hypothetical protein RRG08_031095 [Elysia crispata]